jgi:hypothetical protein
MTVVSDWALVCEQAYFDVEQPGSLSLSRIIEQAIVETIPSSIGPFVIVVHLDGYGERMRVGLRATRPDGSLAALDEKHVSFDHVGPYLLFRISHLEVLAEGRYRFDIIFDDVYVARTVSLSVLRASHDAVDIVH